MSLISRLCLAAALPAVVALAVPATLDSSAYEQQKQSVVQASLQQLKEPFAPEPLLAAAAHAAALLDVEVDTFDGHAVIALLASGSPYVKAFPSADGAQLFVDFYNTVSLTAPNILPPKNAFPVSAIRTRLRTVSPELVSRTVIDLTHPCSFELTQESGVVILTLTPLDKAPALLDDFATPALAPLPPECVLENCSLDGSLDVLLAKFDDEMRRLSARYQDEILALNIGNAHPTGAPEVQYASVAPKPYELPADPTAPLALVTVEADNVDQPAQTEPAPQTAVPATQESMPAPPQKRNEPAPEAISNTADQKMIQVTPEATAKAEPAPSKGAGITSAGSPLDQIVDIDFREMELANVVALLAQKAQINVIAGADLSGTVTANLKNVTLRKAIETVLRMNGLGIVEEEGIYRILPYEEAQAINRVTEVVTLKNANVVDVRKTLDDVLKGSADEAFVSISSNPATNILIIAGPEARVQELKRLAGELDVAKAVTPTATEAIKLNNAEPKDAAEIVKGMLTPQIGKSAIDERSRHIVVTDTPVVLEQVKALLAQVDMPVRQVTIDAMIVDVVLTDESETGVDWIINSVQHFNRRGQPIGSLDNLGVESDAGPGTARPGVITPLPLTGNFTWGILSDDIDFRGVIGAEVRSNNAKLLANPTIVTVENKKAIIDISQEIPYQEVRQSLTGPPMSSTAFKDVGVILEVLPRVTHDDHVISQILAKQSDTKGELNNIPIEDKRQTETTLRTKSGETIFIGGLRRVDKNDGLKKIPVLGDIPVMNLMFRRNAVTRENNELLLFLTCSVLPDEIPALPPALQQAHEEIGTTSRVPNADRALGHLIANPNESPDPAWKWRRGE